ncbi:MAG: UDP-N-acetylmuramoyl-L-alanyl-D-glutamate--2,6-diaminopimelate ligase [Myxococcota bacterium]
MRFSQLLAALPERMTPLDVALGSDPVIRGVTYDSRHVSPGDLFVAVRGEQHDGHAYLSQAVELGAIALLVETLPQDIPESIATAVVPDARRALAPIGAAFFGHPSTEMTLVGVTGTNGKTSTTMLLEAILAAAGRHVGLVGTIELRWDDERIRSRNTTPESLDLQRALRAMRTAGVDVVSMEVSSHGLELGRVEGCRFAVAAVTNISQDHLDFHQTMDAYTDSKLRLFRDHLGEGAAAVINVDDARADAFLAAAREADAQIVRVTQDASADAEVRVEHAEVSLTGTRVQLSVHGNRLDVESPLIGAFNVENLAIAVGVAASLGVPGEKIAAGIAGCPQVPGRIERVTAGGADEPTVLVDYAHTPDAVEKLLASLRPLTPGRLITVFGCGGDRDRTKRPLMAKAVAEHSDRAVATSDNPRTEDPEAILDDVERGLTPWARVAPDELGAREHSFCRVTDRREALELALSIARSKDTVVIAGKGHEDYQIIGRETLPFDDRAEARRALRAAAGVSP